MLEAISMRRIEDFEPLNEFIAVSLKEFASRIETRDKQALSNINKVISALRNYRGSKNKQNKFEFDATPETHELARVLFKDSSDVQIQSAALLEYLVAHGLNIKNQLSMVNYNLGDPHSKLRLMILDQDPAKDSKKEEIIKALSMSNMKYILDSPYFSKDRNKDKFIKRVYSG